MERIPFHKFAASANHNRRHKHCTVTDTRTRLNKCGINHNSIVKFAKLKWGGREKKSLVVLDRLDLLWAFVDQRFSFRNKECKNICLLY